MTSRGGRGRGEAGAPAPASWWFPAIARGRVAVLRTALYAFIFVDVLLTTAWVDDHAAVPGELYRALFVGRLLDLPTPTPALITAVKVALLVCAAVAASGRSPRLVGTAVAVLYLEWMVIAMSYGKVDHDRFAFLLALFVLPTAGPARWGDREPDERAGWPVRMIQLGVVVTYFLSTYAKLRFGGIDWLTSSTLMRAVVHRGTTLAEPLEDLPGVLVAAQFGIVAFELATPLLWAPGRLGRAFLAGAFAFHAITYATIRIVFLPHVMCLLAFVPLERLGGRPAPQAMGRPGRGREVALTGARGPSG